LSDLVVDASAAVHLALLARLPAGLARYQCVAPPLMWSEGLSALVEGAFRGDIPAPALDEALERLEALSIALQEVDSDHRRRSLRLARSLGWAKSYDAEYVALAQALGCPLLTVDARLTRGAGHLVEILGPGGLYTR
jgi:predicted nucleic acid-binding protein